MLKTIGWITLGIVFVNLASTGALNELGTALTNLMEPTGITLRGMWNGGFGETAEEIERLVCDRQGSNCEVQGGQE